MYPCLRLYVVATRRNLATTANSANRMQEHALPGVVADVNGWQPATTPGSGTHVGLRAPVCQLRARPLTAALGRALPLQVKSPRQARPAGAARSGAARWVAAGCSRAESFGRLDIQLAGKLGESRDQFAREGVRVMDIVDVVANAQKTRVMAKVVQLCGDRRLALGGQLGGC